MRNSKEARMRAKENPEPESDGMHRAATILQTLVVAIMILPAFYSRGVAETKIVWSSFCSGTIVQCRNEMRVESIIGDPFFGSGAAGSIVLSTGFGTYILSEGVISGISNLKADVPAAYFISQNYPNPFNPSTTIEYGLPSASMVRLTIFDILGRNIATLYNGEQSAGIQRLKWNAAVSTGVYFYRIEATSIASPQRRFVYVMKMLLMK